MPKFNVDTRFIFSGHFTVEAENKVEAEKMVVENCGLVLGRNIHSDLNENDVDWEFSMHPEKEIVSVRKLKSSHG